MQRGRRGCTEGCGGGTEGAEGAKRGCGGGMEGAQRGESLFVLGYHWLPLATTDLVDANKEFQV